MSKVHQHAFARNHGAMHSNGKVRDRTSPLRLALLLQQKGHARPSASHPICALAAAVVTALTLGCSSTTYPASNTTSNRQAPTFTAQTLGGQPVSFAGLEGTVIILHLWAAWDCAEELPGLDDIASRFSLRDITVLAVAIDKESWKLARIAKSQAPKHLRILHDPSGEVANKYKPRDFPAAYVIDRQGTIRYAHHGLTKRDLPEIEHEARQLAAEPSRRGGTESSEPISAGRVP